jgi:PAS domain S-box-containing protein
MVAKGESLRSVLDGICRLVEELSSGSLCSILLLDPEGKRLWHGAAPSLPASYTSAFDGVNIGPETGPCGRAAFSGAPVIVSDIAADPLGEDFRAVALTHGLQACWSTPIFSSEGKALGTFAVLSREPRSPTSQHQRIIAQITHLAAVAIERQRTETALQVSEERFRRMADTIPEVMWFTALDPERILYVSQSFERIWGLKVEDLYANPRLWTETIHPDDRSRVSETFSHWIAGEKVSYHDVEYRIVPARGGLRWIHERGVLSLDEKGKPVLASGISTDITERKRAEALLAGEKRVLEMIARGDALPPILDALCRLVEDLTGGALVSILLVSADGKSLRHGAAPSLPAEYTRAIDGALIGPRAGSCGTAAYRKEPVVASDIETDPLWTDYRQLARSAGLRACWSTPVFSTARDVLGTFALYHRESSSPAPEQQSVVEQFAHLASIAIERTRAQEALRRSEAYLAEAQRLSLTGSFGWSIATGELVWSDETFRIMGYEAALKPTLELVLQRVHPEDIGLVQQAVDRAARDGTEFDFEHRLLMPDGSVKHLHVVARPVRTDSSEVEFVGAVMDVTEQKQAQDALRAAKARFEGILEIAEDAIISVDSEQRIVLFNQGAEKVFGYAQVEIIGQPMDVLLPQRFAHAHRGHVEEFSRSPDVSRTMGQRREVFGRRKDGSEFPAEASISKLNLGGERVFTVILRDITERKQAAEALRLSAQSRQSAVMAERNRLARDIHDTLAQGFTGVIVQLEAAEDAKSQGLSKAVDEHLDRAGDLARESLKEARRSVRALRPQALENLDLCEALDRLIRKMAAGTSLRTEFSVRGQPSPLPAEWEENLLRIGQEFLTNALRHAQASEFKTRLVFDPKEIRLELRDNGRGFDPGCKQEGFGLVGIRERVDGMGGQLAIESAAGRGTAISIVLPQANERIETIGS